jgi:hypothetical protein
VGGITGPVGLVVVVGGGATVVVVVVRVVVGVVAWVVVVVVVVVSSPQAVASIPTMITMAKSAKTSVFFTVGISSSNLIIFLQDSRCSISRGRITFHSWYV